MIELIKSEDDCLPCIRTSFETSDGSSNSSLYRDVIRKTLKRILPPDLFLGKEVEDPEETRRRFQSILPFTYFMPCEEANDRMSFISVFKYRSNAFKFFFEMISRWLVPGERLNVVVMYAADFQFPELGDDIYTVCEVMIQVENDADWEEIQRNLPIIESEVRLGVVSSFYARRIMEIKGLSSDEKTAMIQEHIAALIRRLPDEIDYDIMTEMQHVLVICRDSFKAARESRHLSRLISIQYLFRRLIREAVKKSPEKRYLHLKIFKAKLHLPSGDKQVLGVLIGLNFLKDKELFQEKHIINAIQKFIPSAKVVKNSYFANQRGQENICTVYLEIEKENEELFVGEELQVLRKELPRELESRIEQLTHHVFMPRNEEEIMRNILSLSNQIKYVRDLPQVFISFDEQTDKGLFFNIITVRIIKPGTRSIRESFKKSDSFLTYVHDRNKTVGYLRKKYRKEATVFRLKLFKDEFLRSDHSIDLYKARQAVVNELTRVMGEFRDYNGGMISKQNELLAKVRKLLSPKIKYNDLLLENFFYSLNPVIMRTVLEPEALNKLFLMLLNAIEEGFFNEEKYSMKIRAEPEFVFVMIAAEDRQIEERIKTTLDQFHLSPAALASSCVYVYETPYLGYIYRCDDPYRQRQFCEAIQSTIDEWDEGRCNALV